MSSEEIKQLQKLLDAAEGNLSAARNLTRKLAGTETQVVSTTATSLPSDTQEQEVATESVVEGTFNGQEMVAPDGRSYPVPANYASKSKLVEGDSLKLSIAADGSFIYKQISPVERRNVVGTLTKMEDGFGIQTPEKTYKVLTASVTFYKALEGDTVTGLVPNAGDANWAALENIVKKADEEVVNPGSLPVSDTSTEVDMTPPITEPADLPAQAEIVPDAGIQEPIIAQEEQPQEMATEEPVVSVPTESTAAPFSLSTDSGKDQQEPEIVMPNGASTLSDEELLENIKKNLSSINTNTSTTEPSATQTVTEKPADTTSDADQAISELDI